MHAVASRFTLLAELAKNCEFIETDSELACLALSAQHWLEWVDNAAHSIAERRGCRRQNPSQPAQNYAHTPRLAAPTPWFKRHALRPRTMRVSLPRSQELPPPNPTPPNPTPPSDNHNPTLLEDRPELNASPALSALRQESKKWQDSPKEFFAAVPDSVTKYDRKSPVDFIRGTIAFRIRAGEFFRCRKTWGHRGRRAFRAHVARRKTALSSIDHARWLEFGRTTDMILRRHAAGTIVASCLVITDATFRSVPQAEDHPKHMEFFEQLDAPEAKQYAEEFAALEKALWDYIVKDYSCLKNKIRTHRSHRTTGRPRPHGAHHNHSCNTLLSDEPHQVVFDSLATDLPLQNTDRGDPIDGQSALVDQRPPTCAIAQSDECARMLYNTQSKHSRNVIASGMHGAALALDQHDPDGSRKYRSFASTGLRRTSRDEHSASCVRYLPGGFPALLDGLLAYTSAQDADSSGGTDHRESLHGWVRTIPVSGIVVDVRQTCPRSFPPQDECSRAVCCRGPVGMR
ncbi:hypothetical protein Landi51_13740 [Colletotrichum acutatum]